MKNTTKSVPEVLAEGSHVWRLPGNTRVCFTSCKMLSRAMVFLVPPYSTYVFYSQLGTITTVKSWWIWRVPKLRVTPNHPKLDRFSIETHGFGVSLSIPILGHLHEQSKHIETTSHPMGLTREKGSSVVSQSARSWIWSPPGTADARDWPPRGAPPLWEFLGLGLV